MTSFGRLELKKEHILCSGTMKFRISERMRTLICLIGQSMVFDSGVDIFSQMLQANISAPQIQRVCKYYGGAMDDLIKSNCELIIPKLTAQDEADKTYVMMDGSMLFTREDKWRELKLSRIFHDSQIVDIHQNRKEILQSIYVSHLGSVDEFFPKLERFLVGYKNKVILGDGAVWIWKWAEDNYPGATQILDYYHAREKLVLFAKHQFHDDQKRKDWIKQQADRLLQNELETVIEEVKKQKCRSEDARETKNKLIRYYIENDDRMQYKTYRENGLLIGSGPIEAAHRSVIQQRMKLSGQKWTIKGANAMANLRCYKNSGAWDSIKRLIGAAA